MKKLFVLITQILVVSNIAKAYNLPFPFPGSFTPPEPASVLQSYNVDPSGITVSGISSGAYMAVQMQVAFSQTISGAASVAGGVFWCAQGDSKKAQSECMRHPQRIQVSAQIAQARKLEQTGDIDSLKNLAKQKIYIYASPKDIVNNPINAEKLQEFYAVFTNSSQVHFENTIESAHGFPTLDKGTPCQFGVMPWILNCNYDGAGEILKQMYGTLLSKGTADDSHLLKFDQTEFVSSQTHFYDTGWIYVPSDCAKGEVCKLHIALHGCQMNPDFAQDKFATQTGYNDWAETNHIIIFYPQSAKIPGVNPYGCWDWFGFTGANYVTQSGAQMSALKKMIDRIQGLK